jgi:alpha/beta superfamily hydrolase
MTLSLSGPAGRLEASISGSRQAELRWVLAHPHPLYGGTMENAVVIAAQKALLDSDAEVLRFNFRGVGGSQGVHDRGNGERDDLRSAFDFLSQRRPHRPTGVAGYSFGAAMALSLLDSEAAGIPAALLLLAPPLTHYDFSTLLQSDLPLAVIYGEEDDLTPPGLIADNTAERRAPTVVKALAGAGHDLGSAADPHLLRGALAACSTWLRAQVQQRRPPNT